MMLETLKSLNYATNGARALLAQKMYKETPASMLKRQQNAEARKANAFHNPHPDQRPDKKQRRDLIRFKQQ